MAYHIIVDSRQFKGTLELLRSDAIPGYSNACFSGLSSYYKKMLAGTSVYTCMMLDRKVFRLIKDFNRLFSNIKVIIKFKKKYLDYKDLKNLGYDTTPIGDSKRVYICALGLRFSKEYSNRAKFFMYAPLMQFFRMFSPQLAYKHIYKVFIDVTPTVVGLLDAHKNLSSKFSYGVWCRFNVDLESFMKLDDPEIMNGLFTGTGVYCYYTSDLFDKLGKGGSND